MSAERNSENHFFTTEAQRTQRFTEYLKRKVGGGSNIFIINSISVYPKFIRTL